jgi:hypothetical protein
LPRLKETCRGHATNENVYQILANLANAVKLASQRGGEFEAGSFRGIKSVSEIRSEII